MLLTVKNPPPRKLLARRKTLAAVALIGCLGCAAWLRAYQPAALQSPAAVPVAQSTPVAATQDSGSAPQAAPISRPAMNIVVLDPAHGGTDLGARGAGGVHESD